MSLAVLGINHKTASVSFREQVAFNPERLSKAYVHAQQNGISNVLILSTCNRTEIYSLQTELTDLQLWFCLFLQLDAQQLNAHSYSYKQDDALKHLIRVASGLDSMILGEPQILGQLKQAYAVAQEQQAINKKFAWLMEQVFSATKKVRSESKLGEQAVSMAFAVAKLTEQIFDHLSQKTLMLIAVGEMNQLVARHICGGGIGKIILVNRSEQKAHAFAEILQQEYPVTCEVASFSDIEIRLSEADIVCSCTGSLDTVIAYKWVKKAIKKRRHVPMLMVDLAVPRDIEQKVAKLDDVFHYTVDDLQHVLSENLEKRRTASVYAEVIVSQQITEVNTKQRLKDLGHFMAQYQQAMKDMAQQVQQKAEQQLMKGEDPKQVIQQLSKQLTAKLAHTQFSLLQQAASLEDRKTLDFIVSELAKKNDITH